MLCIYCKKANKNKFKSHALPESIFRNNFIFLNGVICDYCNKKLSILDQALITHPEIANRIQLLKLPGKKGRRKELGYWKNNKLHLNSWDIEGIEIKTNQPKLGPLTKRTSVTFNIKTPPNYSHLLFSRAIHYLALNFLAYQNYSLAMLEKYDGIREFARFGRNSNNRTVYQEPNTIPVFSWGPRVYFINDVINGQEYFMVNVLGIEFTILL